MEKRNVLMIGCGKMGQALLGNWVKSGDDFTIIDPGLATAIDGVTLVSETSELAGRTFDVLIVAIKPQLIDAVMPAYNAMLASKGYVLSIAAGASIQRLRAVCADAPVVRVMPNLPAAIARGVSGICASEDASEAHIAHATAIMDHAGTVITVENEDALDRFTAIAGSGPGYIFEFARSYVTSAMAMGFDEAQAGAMALDVIGGTIAMAQQSDEPLAELRDSVTSKGGTTAAGLDALNGDGALDTLLRNTLAAAYNRAVELR